MIGGRRSEPYDVPLGWRGKARRARGRAGDRPAAGRRGGRQKTAERHARLHRRAASRPSARPVAAASCNGGSAICSQELPSSMERKDTGQSEQDARPAPAKRRTVAARAERRGHARARKIAQPSRLRARSVSSQPAGEQQQPVCGPSPGEIAIAAMGCGPNGPSQAQASPSSCSVLADATASSQPISARSQDRRTSQLTGGQK
jgi:hypothetical protein